jgi:hypothetical protein
MTITEYISTRDILLNTPFIIKPDGSGYYKYGGELIPRLDFQRMYPLPISLVSYKRSNADGTKNWLAD